MCLQAAHRHCLTLKEPWKLQASSSSDRPRIGPGSVSRELRLGRDEGRSPHDEPRTLVVCGLWRRVHRRERWWPRCAATEAASEEELRGLLSKAAKQPRRQVNDRQARITKRTQFGCLRRGINRAS